MYNFDTQWIGYCYKYTQRERERERERELITLQIAFDVIFNDLKYTSIIKLHN